METEQEVMRESGGGRKLGSNSHPQCLLKGACALWERGALCDVMLEAEGVQFHAHGVILSSASSYCRLRFSGNPPLSGPLRLQGVTARGLEQVLGFIYRGHMTVTLETVEDVLQAARVLLLREAVRLCLGFLDSSLDPETCPRILSVARQLGPSQLHSRALAYLGAHCHGLLRDPTLLVDLELDALLELLGQEDLEEVCELDLLHAALRWLQHRPERVTHTRKILSKVRFPLIPPEALLEEVGERPLVCADPHCFHLLREALAYHARPLDQPALQGPSTTLRGATPCLLVLGGRTTGNQVCQEVWVTRQGEIDWRKLGEMDTPLYNHCCVVLNNFLFVLGGQHSFDPCGSQPTNEVHRYDPRTETWLQVPGMQERRTRFHADVLSGTLVAVAGGTSLGKLTDSVERYRPGNSRWEPATPLPVALVDHAGATHREILYISGGFSRGKTVRDLYSFLPRLGCWVLNRPLTFSRCDHGMATIGDVIYCVGGRTLNKAREWVHVNEMEFYRPAVNQWTTVKVSQLGCSQFSLTTSGTQLYITGGGSLRSGMKSPGVFSYSSQDRRWERQGMLPLALVDHCSCTLYLSAQTVRRLRAQETPPTPSSPGISTLNLFVLD